MFFADFSVNSQPIFIKFCMDYLQVTRRLPCNSGLKTNFNLTSLMGLYSKGRRNFKFTTCQIVKLLNYVMIFFYEYFTVVAA